VWWDILRHLRKNKLGVSNVIVVMLSLILIVIIVSNIVLWSHQMSQLDWEKISERIEITRVPNMGNSWTYNPSTYSLGGSTTWQSGEISNLIEDDENYMRFRSYDSGTNIQDPVDNNVTDVDSSPNKGTHSNFTAQKYGPDSIFDTLTETITITGTSNTTLIDHESFEGSWPPTSPSSWTATGRWNKESDQAYNETYSADFDGFANGRSGDLTTCDLNCDDAGAIYVDFWYRDEGCEAGEFLLQYYNGTDWNTIADLGSTASEYQWLHYQQKITDSQYFKSNFKIRWSAIDIEGGEHAYVDYVTITKEVTSTTYELDLEVQWTNVQYDISNEWLCIYTGSMGSENLQVDVWFENSWQNLISSLTTGWNNVSISTYLNSSNFTIRFKDQTGVGDETQDSWEIDVALIHLWSTEHTVIVEFIGESNLENWDQLNLSLNLAWTTSSVEVVIQLFNHTLNDYPTSGNGHISYTSSASPETDENATQTININANHFRNSTGGWKLKVTGSKTTENYFDLKVDMISYTPFRITGINVTCTNRGSLTVHIVAVWIVNSTMHKRHEISWYLNSGETSSYIINERLTSNSQYTIKIVTERGNIAVFIRSP
jgi:hypothetical protein